MVFFPQPWFQKNSQINNYLKSDLKWIYRILLCASRFIEKHSTKVDSNKNILWVICCFDSIGYMNTFDHLKKMDLNSHEHSRLMFVIEFIMLFPFLVTFKGGNVMRVSWMCNGSLSQSMFQVWISQPYT